MMLAYHQDKGGIGEIYGLTYTFEGINTIDRTVVYRAPRTARYRDFMVDDADGHPRYPFIHEMNAIFASDQIIIHPNPSSLTVRRFEKTQALDVLQATTMDNKAPFRIALAKYCKQNCKAFSDNAMIPVITKGMADPAVAKLNLKNWDPPHPATARRWINKILSNGGGKARHGVSQAGRHPRKLKFDHPVEIGLNWMMQSNLANNYGQIQHFYDQYVGELYQINNGIPLDRPLLIENEDGVWQTSDMPAEYPQPLARYKAVSYHTFRRQVRDKKSPRLFGLATTAGGEQSRYGGGGIGERPSFGSLCEIDETVVPNIFLVDEKSGIPMGSATLTLMVECRTKALTGWDLCAEAASSTTLLRTVLHSNSIKDVPPDLLKEFPNLGNIRLRPDIIKCDNSSGAHSRNFEDACAEAYIAVKWTGRAMPTHKPLIERTIGTMLHKLFKKLPSHNYDIALMRKYGFKPDTQVLCTLSKARALLDRAAFTYNISRTKGL